MNVYRYFVLVVPFFLSLSLYYFLFFYQRYETLGDKVGLIHHALSETLVKGHSISPYKERGPQSMDDHTIQNKLIKHKFTKHGIIITNICNLSEPSVQPPKKSLSQKLREKQYFVENTLITFSGKEKGNSCCSSVY